MNVKGRVRERAKEREGVWMEKVEGDGEEGRGEREGRERGTGRGRDG